MLDCRSSVLFTKFWNQPAWITFWSKLGKYRTDDAKMIGMTPAWFTFSGMYVDWPPIILRPTTRLAYWTGIRRWPCSIHTTATMMATPNSTRNVNLADPAWLRMAAPCAGRLE